MQLVYRHTYARRPRRKAEILVSLRQRPNPSMLSFEEAAQAVLGAAAGAYLDRYVRLLQQQQPSITVGAGAVLAAQR